MRRRPEPPGRRFRVTVVEHEVGHWQIPASELEVYALTDVQARVDAAREVHRRAGVAPWRPWVRQTYVRTSAEPLAG